MSEPVRRSRIVVIDNNCLRRAGIVSLISEWAADRELEVRQIATSAALKEFECSEGCRLVLLSIGGGSIRTSETRGIVRILHALAPHAPVVPISDRDEPDEIVGAFQSYCSGYIPTSMEPALALHAIGFILDGGSYFPPSALRLVAPGGWPETGQGNDEDDRTGGEELEQGDDGAANSGESADASGMSQIASPQADSHPGLTGRQHHVLQCVQKGLPNKLIARELGMSEGTVKVHVRQIMRKLGVANRTQVAMQTATSPSVAVRV